MSEKVDFLEKIPDSEAIFECFSVQGGIFYFRKEPKTLIFHLGGLLEQDDEAVNDIVDVNLELLPDEVDEFCDMLKMCRDYFKVKEQAAQTKE